MKKSNYGFTLVELLVVIAIIAILAAVVVLVVNPAEMLRRGRDATRMADLQSLQNAINIAYQENSATARFLCAADGQPANTRCPGSSAAGASTRTNNGTGWVKVDLSSQAVKVPTLPIDPENSATLIYTYESDGVDWEINAVLESDKYTIDDNKMANDGGNDANWYEVGSGLTLMDKDAAL